MQSVVNELTSMATSGEGVCCVDEPLSAGTVGSNGSLQSVAESNSLCSSSSLDASHASPEVIPNGVCKRKTRKISDIHLASASKLPEDESNAYDKKLSLESIVKAVAILTLPSATYTLNALKHVIDSLDPAIWTALMSAFPGITQSSGIMVETSCTDDMLKPIDNDFLLRMVAFACCRIDHNPAADELLRKTGGEVVRFAMLQHEAEYRCLGNTLCDMLNNFDALCNRLTEVCPHLQLQSDLPSFRCVEVESGSYRLIVSTHLKHLKHFMCGVVQYLSKLIFQTEVTVAIASGSPEGLFHYEISITPVDTENEFDFAIATETETPEDLEAGLSTQIICQSFPFHVIFDRRLHITQLGASLTRLIAGQVTQKGLHLAMHFEIVRPSIHMTFSAILARVNSTFELICKYAPEARKEETLKSTHLRGQMLHLTECNSIMFLGSPLVSQVEEMIGRGLFLSDIPIHDATRDLILVGQQTKAQDVLKRKMVTLKEKVEEASAAVEVERKKNVELLNLIFPADIARRLWLGESVPPRRVDDVTMLFSDIVGFTSICSTATPLQVVQMLSTLYIKFDNLCELLDVYKTETIGDAYCVAGGLHRPSTYHAAQAAWMAISMQRLVHHHNDPTGKALQMRIGLHSGAVLAGVVGKTMPRYCLFGNNVSVANRMESTGAADRIHISHTTYCELMKVPGFHCTPIMTEDAGAEMTYFLDGFIHPGVPDDDYIDHIDLTMKELSIKP